MKRDNEGFDTAYDKVMGNIAKRSRARITSLKILQASFKWARLRIALKNTWSIDRGEKNTAFKVRFDAKVDRYIKEEELFVNPRMKDQKDGSLLFEVNNEKEFLKMDPTVRSFGFKSLEGKST